MTDIVQRKLSHLDLCAKENVENARSSLLEEVELFHEALPELAYNEIDCSVDLFGRRLKAPILISAMTGGADRAREINRALASVAQEMGFAMGLGSQRPMLEDPRLASTYSVRDVAPDILLFANIGCVQAGNVSSSAIADMIDAVEADSLCVHLNAAQELVQDEGDRDFRGCHETIAQLVKDLRVPIVVKETGCGLSPKSLLRLREAGVAAVDVAGAGGTTWPGVESMRGSERQRALGTALRNWGIPTAVSLLYADRVGVSAFASGGIRSAQDILKALALGATVAGLALPFLRAYEDGGEEGVRAYGAELSEALKAMMLLVGARTAGDLTQLPILLGPSIQSWMQDGNDLARSATPPLVRPADTKPVRREVAV